MPKRSLFARLTGWPLIKVPYRAHWRVMMLAHPLILRLIEDSQDGETRRTSIAEWERAERPVLALHRGTNSRLRIDGPRQIVGSESFAMGGLIESPGVTAHLDPVETLHLEQRVSEAIEREILRWIDERGLHQLRAVDPRIDREIADPEALHRMREWMDKSRWTKVPDYVR